MNNMLHTAWAHNQIVQCGEHALNDPAVQVSLSRDELEAIGWAYSALRQVDTDYVKWDARLAFQAAQKVLS